MISTIFLNCMGTAHPMQHHPFLYYTFLEGEVTPPIEHDFLFNISVIFEYILYVSFGGYVNLYFCAFGENLLSVKRLAHMYNSLK